MSRNYIFLQFIECYPLSVTLFCFLKTHQVNSMSNLFFSSTFCYLFPPILLYSLFHLPVPIPLSLFSQRMRLSLVCNSSP